MPLMLHHTRPETRLKANHTPPKTSFIRQSSRKLLSATLSITILLFFTADRYPEPGFDTHSTSFSAHSVRQSASNTTLALLEVFQIYPPALTVTPDGVLEITDGSSNASVHVVPSRRPTCQETLVIHSFGASYGQPYVGNYTPPSCSFNRVSWNLTVTSSGRQFDRLGSVSFGDIELFRTSTAEPTQNGIEWTYIKDMTSFLPLFQQEQTIILDLGNIINDIYTGPFNVTLTSSFFTADDSITPADEIIAVSRRQGAAGQPSYFIVPDQTASNNLTLPRNVKKAVFTIGATGQSQEEFWWSNVLQSEIDTFPSYGTLYGFSPFREVQLLIDGMLAGVAWPFPIVFTGGIVPGLWRPIVAIDAFDLKEDEIDITPWLPLLCDGNSHNFTIRVSGLNDTGNGTATLSETTDGYWWVSGKVFLWLDAANHVTTGQGPSKVTPAPSFRVASQVYKTSNGSNETLTYQIDARRSLSFESTLKLSNGTTTAQWSQDLDYTNRANYTDMGNVQTNIQRTSGQALSSSGYARQFDYPLYAYSTAATMGDNLTLTAIVQRGKTERTLGQPVFPTGLESFFDIESIDSTYKNGFQGASLITAQNGSATYMANNTAQASYSFGTTEQDTTFSGLRTADDQQRTLPYGEFPGITQSSEIFHRHALAVNGSVVQDEETLLGRTSVTHDLDMAGQQEQAPLLLRGSLLSGVPGRGGRIVSPGSKKERGGRFA